jgi:hypothetical protein
MNYVWGALGRSGPPSGILLWVSGSGFRGMDVPFASSEKPPRVVCWVVLCCGAVGCVALRVYWEWERERERERDTDRDRDKDHRQKCPSLLPPQI